MTYTIGHRRHMASRRARHAENARPHHSAQLLKPDGQRSARYCMASIVEYMDLKR